MQHNNNIMYFLSTISLLILLSWITLPLIVHADPSMDMQYRLGLLPPQNMFSIELYKANQGIPPAQHTVGMYYEQGIYTPQDSSKAFYWFSQAANNGYTPSMVALGICYAKGLGIKINRKKAIYWLNLAEKYGNNDAIIAKKSLNLGSKSLSSKQVNNNIAIKEYKLGIQYMEGNGVNKNYKEGFKCFLKSAEKGYPDAQYAVGVCYNYGDGVQQSYPNAKIWYEKAARQNHALSQYGLGLFYENGLVGNVDYKKAVYWYKKAVLNGNKEAKKRLEAMSKK